MREVQSLKAFQPMEDTELGMVMVWSAVQPSKARASIVVTLLWIVMDSSWELCLKALSSIFSVWEWIVAEWMCLGTSFRVSLYWWMRL